MTKGRLKRDDNNSLDHSTSSMLLTSRLGVASSFIVSLPLPRERRKEERETIVMGQWTVKLDQKVGDREE